MNSISSINNNTQYPYLKPKGGTTPVAPSTLETAAKIVLSAVFFPFTLAGCGEAPSETCLSNSEPKSYPEFITPSPTSVREAELANGVPVTWSPESRPAITNCDGTTNGIIGVNCKFQDGNLQVPLLEDGSLVIQKTLYRPLTSEVKCDVVYTNLNTGDEAKLENVFPLYPPTVISAQAACDANPSPQILGTIQMDKTEVLVNDQVTFSFPRNLVKACDGSTGADPGKNLSVKFLIENRWHAASQNSNSYYYATAYNHSGNQKVFMQATDMDQPSGAPQNIYIEFYVKDPNSSYGNPIPNLVISPGFGPAPLTVTADASNSYPTDPEASIVEYEFNWGDGIIDNGTASVHDHTYSCANSSCSYTVRLTVTDSNGNPSSITSGVATWQ